MKPNDFPITPEAWLPRGEAMVRGQGRQLVLWNAIPGEPSIARVYHEGQNQDLGRVLRPAGRAHPWRRKPPCERFHACGGCPIMHLNPEGQRDMRLHLIGEALAAHGLQPFAPREIVAGPDGDLDFQTWARLSVGFSDEGHLRLGARGRISGGVVPIPDCPIATPTIRAAMSTVAFHVRELKLYPFEPDQERGLLRAVLLRQSRLSGELLVTVIASKRLPILWELAERVAGGCNAVAGVHLHVNDGPGDEVFVRDGQGTGDTMPMRGKETIEEGLAGLRLRIGPGDLYPSNPGVADRMASDLVAQVAHLSEHPALDLRCGVGGIALALAHGRAYSLGLDSHRGSVERARENALHNKVKAEFLSGSLDELLPEIARRLSGTAPVVHVDCSRRRLEPALAEAALAAGPATLFLQSTNPRTLAADLAELAARGWRVEQIGAYDMYPQTPYTALLARLGPPAPVTIERRPPRRKVLRG